MKRTESVDFIAKAIAREDGRFDPAIEAVLHLSDGSVIREVDIVGRPFTRAEYAIEWAIEKMTKGEGR